MLEEINDTQQIEEATQRTPREAEMQGNEIKFLVQSAFTAAP